jgi:hypothetical protein
MTFNVKLQFPVILLVIIINLSIFLHNSFSFDNTKIFFAGDSSTTYCRESITGPDLYFESLFSRLKASPPPGFIIEPSQDIVSLEPCSLSHPDVNGYGALKVLDWNTQCTDASSNGICSWSCNNCPLPECEINRSTILFGGEADWCCCASRRSCIDQSDAQYVILNLLANDLLQLFKFYNGDVDLVIEEAKSLTNYIMAQGRTVIWLTFYPVGYGSLGNGESSCADVLSCLLVANSNAEYFYDQFIPWITSQPDVYLIDFFGYIKDTYVPNPISFINTYGYDGVHLKPGGHQIFYDYVFPRLTTLLTEINDQDGDGIFDNLDNCPNHPNGPLLGICLYGLGEGTCMTNEECGLNGFCSMNQEDNYPPPEGNDIGDVCECEGNFDCDDDCDGSDAFLIKEDFGRSQFFNPCESGDPCNGDFDCDNDCDGSDAHTFKRDFGRSSLSNPCPACEVGIDWCVYQ